MATTTTSARATTGTDGTVRHATPPFRRSRTLKPVHLGHGAGPIEGRWAEADTIGPITALSNGRRIPRTRTAGG